MTDSDNINFDLHLAQNSLQAPIVWLLADAGFSADEARAWAGSWLFLPDPVLVLAEANAFDDHGLSVDDAIEWHTHGFLAHQAFCFHDAGYTPHQAATTLNLAGDEVNADEWVATGMPPERVIAYLQAKVSLNEVHDFEHAAGGPQGALAMLGALVR